MDNPYQPPAVTPALVDQNRSSLETLRRMALYQRGVVTCLAIYVAGMFAPFVLPEELHDLLMLAILVDGLVGTVFVFLLSTEVYGTGLGILMGALTLIPCFGLFILALTSGKATASLRRQGVKVGW